MAGNLKMTLSFETVTLGMAMVQFLLSIFQKYVDWKIFKSLNDVVQIKNPQ